MESKGIAKCSNSFIAFPCGRNMECSVVIVGMITDTRLWCF